jgi:hypothetical protein
MTKNITLAIDEATLETVRIIAAEEKTTVNALVRDFLNGLAEQRNRRAEARAAFKELAENSTGRLGPDYVWNREDAYADRVFPRHERSAVRREGEAG